MTLGRYLAGVALLALTFAPLVFAAVRLRGRLLPDWTGASARLAEAVLGLALLLALAHLLGVIGLLRPLPVAAAAVLCGAMVAWLVPPSRAAERPRTAPRPGRAGLLLAAAGTAVVVGQWAVGTVDALDAGMYGSDTLRYHGPVAARFVQEHGVTGLHFLLNDPTLTFFPFDSELLHALGIVFMGSDVLSPLINLGWLALALLAAWCVGRPHGLGPATLLLAALVLASPALAQSQPGSGDNDIVALALLLASVALLLEWEGRWQPVAVAGLAAGIALGTKLTVFGIVGAITVGLALVVPRAARRAVAGAWLGALLAAGGFWYARNLFTIGNPLPWFGFGPLHLPSPPFLQDPSVAHYLTDTQIWRTVYFPGFHDRFGTVWVVVAALALAGIVLAVVRGANPMHRMLGAVGAIGLVAYAVAPNTAAGPEGFPIFFSATARYAAPALALGLVLLPLVPWLRSLAARAWVQAVLFGLLLATLTEPGRRAARRLARARRARLPRADRRPGVGRHAAARAHEPARRGRPGRPGARTHARRLAGRGRVRARPLRDRVARVRARYRRFSGGAGGQQPPVPPLWNRPLQPRPVPGPPRARWRLQRRARLSRVAPRARRRPLRVRGGHAGQRAVRHLHGQAPSRARLDAQLAGSRRPAARARRRHAVPPHRSVGHFRLSAPGRDPVKRVPRDRRNELIAVSALTLLAFALRLAAIRQGLFGDELLTYNETRGSLDEVFEGLKQSGAEVTPPFYFMLAWVSAKLGGGPELIRLPSLAVRHGGGAGGVRPGTARVRSAGRAARCGARGHRALRALLRERGPRLHDGDVLRGAVHPRPPRGA